MMNISDNIIWRYKSFNMANELDVAGEFIYDGVQTLNEMSCIEESASLFSFLYHVSVGIERLQKIIVVLCENITVDDYEEFEKSLITHSHSELSERIAKHMTSKFNAKENDFLQVLTVFYKKARYNRFAVNASGCEEEKVLSSYVEKYLENDRLQYNFITNKIVVEGNVRELIGRVVGNISKKYYNFLKEKARENNTYSYELRTYSKAEKIFLSNNRKNSLQDLKVAEMTVLKEFFVYLRNTKNTSATLRYIEKVKPLDIDAALLNDYISELVLGNVSQGLIDEVETLYEENKYSIERMREVGVIGDTDVLFEIGEVFDCILKIEDFIGGNENDSNFVREFPKLINKIDDDEIAQNFYEAVELCEQFSKKQLKKEEFVAALSDVLFELKSIYRFCENDFNEE